MKVFFDIIKDTPKWVSAIIIAIYCLLLSEYADLLSSFIYVDESSVKIFSFFRTLSYNFTLISGLITWLIYSLVFHITAQLFGGTAKFKDFAFISATQYIAPIIALLICLFSINSISIPNTPDYLEIFKNNQTIKTAISVINCSYIISCLGIVIIVRHLYRISWIYSFLSVSLPIIGIFWVTEIVKLLY